MDIEPPSLLIIPLILDVAQSFGVLLLVFLVCCSAMISGAEVALFSLTPSDFELDENKRSKQQNIIIKLLDRPKKLLATILVTNNTVNIAIVILFESLSSVWFQNISTNVNLYFFHLDLVFFLKVGLATFIILLFGEILPKIYASRNKESFSILMAYPLRFLDVVLSPISLPMRSATIFIHRRFGKQKTNLSVDQLSQALELTSEEHTTKEEHKILKGIVSFGNTDTKQVMKPRMDIFALKEGLPYTEILPQIIDQGYSRIPVYRENLDNIIGVLYVKDLMPHIDKKEFEWTELLRVPYFVPENKKLDDLLNEFKEKRIHLAIVVDEYGGTCGLISLEDVIEEVVGDISDEYDDEDLIFSKLDDNNFVFEGKTPLKDFYRVVRIEDPTLFEENKGEAETLAGFLLEVAKGFPKKGEVITFHNFTFTVEAFENKRIKQIKLSLNKSE